MKLKRTLLVILLLFLAVAVLVACKGKQDNTTPDDTPSENTEPKEPTIIEGSKTLLIYMCGSNLETKQGLASKNIDELLSAEISANTNIVIQTGGAKTWRKHGISADRSQRYVVKNGKLELLSSEENQNMGEAKTLTDFLVWGQNNYLAERNMLILWDHGGGAAKGVCFDENHAFDALTLTEIKQAFQNATLKTKFDVVGFDACLMASIEVAVAVKDYADYMIASEEIVPAGGWDYKALAESFDQKDDLEEIGKTICDSFMAKCEEAGQGLFSTLSVLDLSQTDAVLAWFDECSLYLGQTAGSKNFFSKVLTAAYRCEKFGYDNLFGGSSNMVDFYDFACLVSPEKMFYAIFDIEEFVCYSVSNEARSNYGVSFYYPISWSEKEVRQYIELGISATYNAYLGDYYLNVPQTTIEFTDMGSIAADGAFRVALTENSRKYLAAINYMLIETAEDGTQHILFTAPDINADWDNMVFNSNFTGIRRTLDGHKMYSNLLNDRGTFLDFSAPALVNGKETYIRYYYTLPKTREEGDAFFDNNISPYLLVGTCAGKDENGLPDVGFHALKEGDAIQLVTDRAVHGRQSLPCYGEAFVVDKEGPNIVELPLDGKTYQYVYIATDIFGNNFFSDMATFEMKYTYEYLLENSLPEGTYAADVTKIESYQ